MDKKVLTLFLALLSLTLAGCGTPDAAQAAALGTPEAQRSLTPAVTATMTVSPTPTVGWQETAIVAQATADEARRLDTAATAAEKERVQVQLGWTAQADIWTAQSDQATATAYATSVPLTGTARSEDMTAISGYQTLTAGQLTAVKEQPTQQAALMDAENYRRYGAADYIVRMAALGTLSVFFFGVGMFAFASRPKPPVAPASQKSKPVDSAPATGAEKKTVVIVKKDNGQGFGEHMFLTLPCSPEQLSELARRVIENGESLKINNWEGEKTSLTRNVIYELRNFFMANKLAISAGGGRVVLNDEGRAFLHGWLEKGALPHSYSFAHKDASVPDESAHEYEPHVYEQGGA